MLVFVDNSPSVLHPQQVANIWLKQPCSIRPPAAKVISDVGHHCSFVSCFSGRAPQEPAALKCALLYNCHVVLQTAYASVPENRQLDNTLGLGSGSSSRSQQGSGHLGSGHLGSGQLGLSLNLGSGHQGSGHLGLNHSQDSGPFQELLGQSRSGSGASGWLRGSGSGSGQFGSPHLSGAGPSQPDSPFATKHEQQYQNPGQHASFIC